MASAVLAALKSPGCAAGKGDGGLSVSTTCAIVVLTPNASQPFPESINHGPHTARSDAVCSRLSHVPALYVISISRVAADVALVGTTLALGASVQHDGRRQRGSRAVAALGACR